MWDTKLMSIISSSVPGEKALIITLDLRYLVLSIASDNRCQSWDFLQHDNEENACDPRLTQGMDV